MIPAPDNGFAEIGSDVKIYPLAKILGRDRITLGSHIMVDDFVFLGSHKRLVIGNHVHLASHASITGGGVCLCCDFVGISSGARILTGTDSFDGDGLTGPTIPAEYRSVVRGSVLIGAHTVIGANAVVLPNVKIGEGAIVGAGSIVTKDLDPWGIYVGSPARRVRTRPHERILEYEEKLIAQEGILRRFRTAAIFEEL